MKTTALFLAITVLFSSIVSGQQRARTRAISAPISASQGPSNLGQTLPIRRVILYSNGVAYFERRGTVTGHAEVALQFKQSQVDDVLKSMVVLDLGKGRIGAVSYNSSAPPSARLNDIPFSVQSETAAGTQGGLAGVLRQLQGAKVSVTTASRSLTGSILTVEERKEQIDAAKPAVTTHTLVISSDTGEIMSFDLAEVRSVKLLDEGSKRDLSQFADATASARRRDAKTIVVTSDGEGSREMVVSYTVAAPIWKTSYRVILDSSGQPFFQGWAIVDNVTEEDWKNVSLSLVSGTPVSFIQPIQQPLYRYRPVIPIPTDLNLTPQVYESSEGQISEYNIQNLPSNGAGGGVDTLALLRPGAVDGNRGRSNNFKIDGSDNNDLKAANPAARRGTISDRITSNNSVETAASGQEVGDLFEYKIDQPVTVLHDRSALIPILQTKMEGERVSIYNPAVRTDRPMGGMHLLNTSNLTLEDGALTVIDGDSYAGEALLARFKPGEKRLISYELDLGTLVTMHSDINREPQLVATVINGVLHLNSFQTDTRIYKITNQTDKPRKVYIEHPKRTDWTLSEKMPKTVEQSQSSYRFRVDLKERETVEFPVEERHQITESFVISDITRDEVDAFIARGALAPPLRAVLEKIISIRNLIAAQDLKIQSIAAEKSQISEDQARLRENIKALKDTPEARTLIARYVDKANQQETRLEQLDNDAKSAQTERNRLQSELVAVANELIPTSKQ